MSSNVLSLMVTSISFGMKDAARNTYLSGFSRNRISIAALPFFS